MAYQYLYPVIVAIIFLTLFIRHKASQPRRPAHFPPGPPALPLLGNIHQIPLQKSFLQFATWSRTYGPITGLKIGSTNAIILNSWRVVRDLLDHRGSIYSSRPDFPIVQYVVPGDLSIVFLKYGGVWRKNRKTTREFLKESVLERLVPVQNAETNQMMWEILRTPERYHDHIMRVFAGVVLNSVYGQRSKKYENGRAKEFFEVQEEWAGLLDQGAMPPYNIFPFLRWVPDQVTPWKGWRKRAEELKRRQQGLYHELFEETKERLTRGKGKDCFLAGLLREQEKDGFSDLELQYIAGLLLEGGADTTAMTTLTFVLAMAAYPEAQKQAQSEVDRVFREQDMPGIGGYEELPYIRACFLEALRWRPALPISIPHATSQDDTYEGYFIPAGTTIVMNTWGIQHDPDEFDDPDTFNPSRFLSNKYGSKISDLQESDSSRKEIYAFGAGRRVCPGQQMAENSMMVAISKLVWGFEIVPKGKPDTDVKTAFKDAILTGPKEFPVEFRVRGEKKRKVIEEAWKKADAYLSRFE